MAEIVGGLIVAIGIGTSIAVGVACGTSPFSDGCPCQYDYTPVCGPKPSFDQSNVTKPSDAVINTTNPITYVLLPIIQNEILKQNPNANISTIEIFTKAIITYLVTEAFKVKSTFINKEELDNFVKTLAESIALLLINNKDSLVKAFNTL